ncbi:MAG: chemotaxis protein, partial [Bradyrhizobium sp.]|nr:chemotaxis protein [Bradyrhizobium sp.]
MRSTEPLIVEAERLLQGFETMRGRIDAELKKPKAERDPAMIDAVVPALTKVIETAATGLRLALETQTDAPSATMTRLVGLRHLTAEMAEYAGRERAFLAGSISSQAKLSADGIGLMSGLRGHVELAWDTISPLAQRADVSANLVQAIKDVQLKYFQTYGSLRGDVIAQAKTGEYKIAGNDYMSRATSAINAILTLGQAIASDADREANALVATSTANLIFSGSILLA